MTAKSEHLALVTISLRNSANILPFICLGIGDGGNELGMGKVKEMVKASMPNGSLIACDVPADFAITAGMDIASLYCLSNVNNMQHHCLMCCSCEHTHQWDTKVMTVRKCHLFVCLITFRYTHEDWCVKGSFFLASMLRPLSCLSCPPAGVSNWGGYAVACGLYLLQTCPSHQWYRKRGLGLEHITPQEQQDWTANLPSVDKVSHVHLSSWIRSSSLTLCY